MLLILYPQKHLQFQPVYFMKYEMVTKSTFLTGKQYLMLSLNKPELILKFYINKFYVQVSARITIIIDLNPLNRNGQKYSLTNTII
jgi:hypothetical protein